jgi:hypothetical protein
MPGGLDANGIYIYAEDDDLSPFSALLNKLADSTSDEFTADRNRLDAIERKGVLFQASAQRDLVSGTTYTAGLSGFSYVKSLDPLDWQNPSVNPDRITPTIAGYYRITATYQQVTVASSGVRQFQVFKNTSRMPGAFMAINDASSNFMNMNGSFIIAMNGSTDYFQIPGILQTSGANVTAIVTVTIEYL